MNKLEMYCSLLFIVNFLPKKNIRELKTNNRGIKLIFNMRKSNSNIPFISQGENYQRVLNENYLKILILQNFCFYKTYLDFLSIIEIFSIFKKALRLASNIKKSITPNVILKFSVSIILFFGISYKNNKTLFPSMGYFYYFNANSYLLGKTSTLILMNFLKKY
jgi:hypothetical protein